MLITPNHYPNLPEEGEEDDTSGHPDDIPPPDICDKRGFCQWVETQATSAAQYICADCGMATDDPTVVVDDWSRKMDAMADADPALSSFQPTKTKVDVWTRDPADDEDKYALDDAEEDAEEMRFMQWLAGRREPGTYT